MYSIGRNLKTRTYVTKTRLFTHPLDGETGKQNGTTIPMITQNALTTTTVTIIAIYDIFLRNKQTTSP